MVLSVGIDLQNMAVTVFFGVFQTGFDRRAFAAVDGTVKDADAV